LESQVIPIKIKVHKNASKEVYSINCHHKLMPANKSPHRAYAGIRVRKLSRMG